MAKKNKTLGKLLVVGGVGLGGYYLYKVGTEKGWWASLLGGSTTAPVATTPTTTPTDPVALAVDGALGLLAWLQANKGTVAAAVDGLAAAGVPVAELPAAAAATAAAGTSAAANAAWNAFGIALPIWLGTSKQAAELTHQANVALTHAIGMTTGLDIGLRTLVTNRGPFMVNSNTHLCYDMAGKKITCPAPEDVIGIEIHSYEYMIGQGVTP